MFLLYPHFYKIEKNSLNFSTHVIQKEPVFKHFYKRNIPGPYDPYRRAYSVTAQQQGMHIVLVNLTKQFTAAKWSVLAISFIKCL